MMPKKLVITEKNGVVQIPFTEHLVTFEVIETIYLKILPLLKRRRKAGLIEGETEK